METARKGSGAARRRGPGHMKEMKDLFAVLLLAAPLAASGGCSDDHEPAGPGGGGSAGTSYRDLLVPVYEDLIDRADYEGGRWLPDPDGSASLWATAFLYPWGEKAQDPDATNRARETLLALLSDLQGPIPEDPTRLLLSTPACFAGLSGGEDAMEGTIRSAVEGFLNRMDREAEARDFYLEGTDSGMGATQATALLAWANLLYRDRWDRPPDVLYPYPTVGIDLIEGANREAWDEEKGTYRPEPWAHDLDVLSNGWMGISLMKAFENEELVPYQGHAERAMDSLEGLWDSGQGGYQSPSGLAEGKKTLAENNLVVTALLGLYKNLSEERYLVRAKEALDFVADHLYWDGRLHDSIQEGGSIRDEDGWSVGESFHFLYNVLLIDTLEEGSCMNMLGRRPMDCGDHSLPGGILPGETKARHGEAFDEILETLLYRVPWRDGDILYDYGDMPGYAAWVLFDLARETGQEEYAQVATAVADRIVRLIHEDLVYYLAEISFGGYSLYAAKRYYGSARPVYEDELDRLLGLAAFLARLDGGYLDIIDRLTGGGNYGYGATSLTAQVAYLLFLSRYYLPDRVRPMWDEYPRVALEMVDAANREAWNEEGGYYIKSPAEPEIYLIADGYMVYTLVEAYRYTGDPAYLDRAKRVVDALDQILGGGEEGGLYALPPALPSLGYKSLSSNSYGFKAYALLYHATGDELYLEKARSIMEFLMGYLHKDGIVYHHRYKGISCTGDIWCPGCNFRILQYMDYLDDLEKNGTSARKDRP